VKVRFGDRYIERPFKELALEALGTRIILYVLWSVLKRGYGH